jgi:hypothetical protein
MLNPSVPGMSDIVAKGVCPSERARLIQGSDAQQRFRNFPAANRLLLILVSQNFYGDYCF